ncbi:MAG: hypothetical protein GEV13_00500 [Rhodospirillales bacterium]|nr:hypothetical protein [Rhodospirillales bacterium]
MKLQGRNLEPNLRGDDVALLQDDLRRLGFAIGDVAGFFGSTTLAAVVAFKRRQGVENPDGGVDQEWARRIDEAVGKLDVTTRVVLGSVRREDGSPLARAVVRAVDKGIRRDAPLGEARTNEEGRYEIRYPARESDASLVVRAVGRDGRDLAASSVVFTARPVEVVDLVTGDELRGQSQFSRVDARLAAALAAEGISATDLAADEVEFVARKHDLDVRQLQQYVSAARLQADSDLPAAVHYALLRPNLPASLPALLAQDPAVLKGTLEAALEENVIAADLRADLDRVLDRLPELSVKEALRPRETGGKASLGDLLGAARLTADQQSGLLTRYLRREGSVEEFWQELEADSTFGRDRVREAQLSLQLGTLTNRHVPLIDALRREGITTTRDLVRFKESDWFALLRRDRGDGRAIGAPADMPGKNEEEKQATYARVLEAIVEDAFPTAFLAARLAEDGDDVVPGAPDTKRDLLTFLERNPDFELARTSPDAYLRRHANALEGVADQSGLRQTLKTFHRLSAITPARKRYAILKPLLQRGWTSARAIARKGSAAVAALKDSLGEKQAQALVNRASLRAAAAETLYAEFSPSMRGVVPIGIFPGINRSPFGNWYEGLPADDPDLPDWRSLFGNIDYCRCEHCQSVLSPAAYLVDILAFVNDHELGEALLVPSRRGDIGNMELSCANTNTPLPYIDLVNEILENVVAGGGAAHQTTWTAAELRAQPEHRNDEAYATLAGAVYPWSLPFSLPHEEAWRYLDHLGVPRDRLMEALRSGGSALERQVAADHLHLGPVAAAIVTGESGHTVQELWGMPGRTLNELRAELRSIPAFLRQAELRYIDLLERLSLLFVNPNGNRVEFEDISVCDLETAHFRNPLSETFLDRFQRFERLRRTIGWSAYDLDRAIAALAPGEQLDDAFLVRLSAMKRLGERLRVAPAEMLSWWSTIDTRTYRPDGLEAELSLYERRFQNKIAFDLDGLTAFELNGDGDELAHLGASVTDHLPSLTAALSVSTSDILTVTDAALGDLDLATISLLFRHASLARALGLPIHDLVSLRQVSGVDPFASPSDTLRFGDIVGHLQAAGIDVPLLLFLLWHRQRPGGREFLSHSGIGTVLNRLRSGLFAIREQTALPQELESQEPPDETPDEAIEQPSAGAFEDFTERQLGQLLDQDDLAQALALIKGSPPADPEAFIRAHLPFLDAEEALGRLVGQDGGPPELDPATQPVQRFTYVLVPLLAHLRRILSEAHVKQTLAAELTLPARAAELLLAETLVSSQGAAERLIEDFLREVFVTSGDDLATERTAADEATADVYAVQFEGYTRLWKAAALATTLELSPDDLDWLQANGSLLNLLDFNELPASASEGELEPDLFAAFARLLDLAQLRKDLPPGEATLFELIEPAIAFDPQADDADEATEDFLERFHAHTGWDLADLTFLASPAALDLTFPDDYRSGHAIRRLMTAIKHLERLGVSASRVVPGWTAPALAAPAAQQIKAAAKAKFDEKQWLRVAESINDELREKQRSALLGFLIADEDRSFETANDVYARYLIDPQMSACMLTSRIKQAISSVQLFVQRVLLNLEDNGLSLSSSAAETWNTWMKQYRIWEAARFLFIFPENWIEPELRDDKTPFFRELETEILQSAISQESVEAAFRHYLEKLKEVARLDLAGIYSENDERHHVFARTPNNPHVYYYRRWDFPQRWTPWERVDVDIEGDHLIPIVLRNRLFLFWPIFSEKPVDENPPQSEGSAAKPQTYLEVTLAWSEYKRGSWASKNLSLAHLVIGSDLFSVADSAKTNTFFRTRSLSSTTYQFNLAYHVASHDATNVLGTFTYDLVTNSVDASQVIVTQADFLEQVWNPPDPAGFTEPLYMKFIERSSPHPHAFIPYDPQKVVLPKTPGRFKIAYPHQYFWFTYDSPFFYEDNKKTFAVYPFDVLKQQGGGIIPDVGISAGVRTTHNVMPDAVDRVVPLFTTMVLAEREGDDLALAASGADEEEGGGGLVSDIRPLDLVGPSPALPAASSEFEKRFRFHAFYHPYVHEFLSLLTRWGLPGLLGMRGTLGASHMGGSSSFFADRYGDPLPHTVMPSYPVEVVSFLRSDAYADYNWELFFHAPLLIADRLRQDQRFEEALRWFHYIFDPTDNLIGQPPQSYWKFRPFFEYDLGSLGAKPIDELLKILSQGSPVYENQVEEWRSNPFNPHAVARLRPIAYQKTVVMKYLDTLIGWGDQLFRRDTIESINEATQLYIFAAEILGPRPTEIPEADAPPAETFNSIEPRLDEFSNALIEIENSQGAILTEAAGPGAGPAPLGTTLYFCVPKNDKLLGYWDTVADRLFKIRHCMNIEGVVRELPLFEPPIPPGLLVQAAAMGVDISSAVNDLNAPLPLYRFQVLTQKASELAAEVKSLGAALLSALEKRDAENLALLRAGLEVQILEAAENIKVQQKEEALEAQSALERGKDLPIARLQYYARLLAGAGNEGISVTIEGADVAEALEAKDLGLNNEEISQLNLAVAAIVLGAGAVLPQMLAGAFSLIPSFSVGIAGFAGSPQASVSFGGGNLSGAASAAAGIMQQLASLLDRGASIAGTVAGFRRRAEEWGQQILLARIEDNMIKEQIEAAKIRVAIAEKEIQVHKKQIEQSKQVQDLMEKKYTNQELYGWMISQLSTVYFQTYQLAYDLAKRAERAFRHELGLVDTNYIQFGYWDNLKKGLLSGERLFHDVKRMEIAYLEQNKRELEITKHVSLVQLDPLALLQLRQHASCEVDIPEVLYDLDFPGHYMRRIKSVSLTLPCVTGPYTGVSCTLTLLRHSVRTLPSLNEPVQETLGAVQAIATSSGQNDSGLFQLDFRDERYLPFERAGAVSRWRLDLPSQFRQFDYDTITDAILHISYTARDGGAAFRSAVELQLQDRLESVISAGEMEGLTQLFSARHDFPNQWHQFLHPVAAATAQALRLDLGEHRFPFMFKGRTISLTAMHLLLKPRRGFALGDGGSLAFTLTREGGASFDSAWQPAGSLVTGLPYANPFAAQGHELGTWIIEVTENDVSSLPAPLRTSVDAGDATHQRLNPEAFDDVLVVVQYGVT